MVRAHERESSRRLARLPSGHGPWWVAHPARPALRLEWEGGGSAVVLVAGNVDVATAPQLEAFVATRPLTDCAVLELDLADVLSMGSVGLSALLSLRRWCLQRGMELRVRGAHPSVWRVFQVTGLDAVFASSPGTAGLAPAQDLALF